MYPGNQEEWRHLRMHTQLYFLDEFEGQEILGYCQAFVMSSRNGLHAVRLQRNCKKGIAIKTRELSLILDVRHQIAIVPKDRYIRGTMCSYSG